LEPDDLVAHIRRGDHPRPRGLALAQEARQMKPGKDENGRPLTLYKRIHVKVIVGEKVMRHDFCAPARRGYCKANIEDTIEKVIEHLDQKFPTLEFRQVDILPNVVNFIACGTRPQPGAQNEAKASGESEDGRCGQSSMPDPGSSDRSAASSKTESSTSKSEGRVLPEDRSSGEGYLPSVRRDA